ncbi:MAG: hypothetical protein CFH41_00094 [Alphaproteobacteria bacterium MarineAlpha11_Bin1]|nr:MAG: hypothetical protein CFH41_00094 [Alphaproteobacteria bacterium MarineAlpha11_Bin1]|tara:strand:+ start:7196 stop:7498 length:303 start_codon:yes stop_codon:yes gene_type:complete
MRALKALVIGMAVIIVAGVVVLIFGIIDKTGELDSKMSEPLADFGITRVVLPAGAQISETLLDGDRILLRLTLADGTSRMMLIDANDGGQIGQIDLTLLP